MYESAREGLVVTPVATAPELTQATTGFPSGTGAMLDKLDHYTMSTDMGPTQSRGRQPTTALLAYAGGSSRRTDSEADRLEGVSLLKDGVGRNGSPTFARWRYRGDPRLSAASRTHGSGRRSELEQGGRSQLSDSDHSAAVCKAAIVHRSAWSLPDIAVSA